jgi:hypothetical protein
VEINKPGRTSGRSLLEGWAATVCLRARSSAAPFLCVGSITIESPSSERVPVSFTELRVPFNLCVSLVCDVCWGPSGSQRLKEGMREVFPTGLGAGPREGTRICVSLEDPPSSHMLVSEQATLRWRNCIPSQRASVASYG